MKIETIIFDRRTATKLGLKHGISTHEILCAVENSDESQRNWVVSRKHGGRLRVRTETTSGRIIYISLSPIDIDNGIWKCITAFSPTNEWYEDE